jgi:hypothetical protein
MGDVPLKGIMVPCCLPLFLSLPGHEMSSFALPCTLTRSLITGLKATEPTGHGAEISEL